MLLSRLHHPIIAAPMAGGPSTPALAAAVSAAGGLGFLAAGYRSVDDTRAQIDAVRAQLGDGAAFGINLFVPGSTATVDHAAVAAYADRLGAEARRYGVAVGEPRDDDDGWEAKLALVAAERVPAVSFAFGCPTAEQIAALHEAGCEVWATVTTADEARLAVGAGADVLIAQGVEAGGHRASFLDADAASADGLALLPLLRLLAAAAAGVPLVAAGGIVDGPALAAAVAAGATAAQLGTAFLAAPEAGTSAPHRDALATDRPTGLTRAFSGRSARGIVNRFMRDHGPHAPTAYPHLHHATVPLRAAARRRDDAEGINLWAGQAHVLATDRPAAEIVARIGDEARAALDAAATRLGAD